MKPRSARVDNGLDLGKARRTEGLILGSLAIAPVVLAAVVIFFAPIELTEWISFRTAAWSGALLAFLAGVRRGLTFSESVGARDDEILSMLWIFACGILAISLPYQTPSLLVAIIGFFSVGILDWRAARSQEAPRYFLIFRPLQMFVVVAALTVIVIRSLSTGP
jgi:hypothetical protein